MSAPESTLSVAHGALPAEDPAGETVAAIAQAQTISAGTQKLLRLRNEPSTNFIPLS